jgi:WD40 repeat protein
MKKYLTITIILFFALINVTNAQQFDFQDTNLTDSAVGDVRLSPNKQLLAISEDRNLESIKEYQASYRDSEVEIEDEKQYHIIILNNDEELSEKFILPGHKGLISSISFSPDSKKLISTGIDCKIKIWDLETGKEINQIETTEYVFRARFSSNENEIIASQYYLKPILTYDLNGNIISQIEIKDAVCDFEINYNTNELFIGFYTEMQVWSLVADTLLRRIPFEDRLMSMRFNYDFSQLAVGFLNGDITVFSNEFDVLYELKGHWHSVLSVCFSFCGAYLGSASGDTHIRIWDLNAQKTLLQLINKHDGFVNGFEFISDKNEFITKAPNKNAKIWR